MAPDAPLVELEKVTFTYLGQEKPLFKGLSLRLQKGEWLSITGPSGSGKTSLLRMLYGAVFPLEGEVRVLGTPVDRRSRYRLRRQMGLVFQSFELLPRKTVLENVVYGAEILGWPPRRAREKAEQRLADVGLLPLKDRRPGTLSGGEQQRVGLARALIHEPPLILADEPTGNLDPANARNVFEILWELKERWGSGVVLVTHSRDLVEWSQGQHLELGRL
ncbi:MAG: ABC transporter ATP-binding protein [Bacillota bacterium]|nr:ABC transporter ATP-binding protein [Bacillota bacterium]